MNNIKAFIVLAAVNTDSTTSAETYNSTAILMHNRSTLISWVFPSGLYRKIQTINFTITIVSMSSISCSAEYFGFSLNGNPTEMAVDTAYGVTLSILGVIYK